MPVAASAGKRYLRLRLHGLADTIYPRRRRRSTSTDVRSRRMTSGAPSGPRKVGTALALLRAECRHQLFEVRPTLDPVEFRIGFRLGGRIALLKGLAQTA